MEKTLEAYDIFFDKKMNAVVMKWNGYATTSQFREGTELMLNILIKNQTSCVLADVKNMTMIGMDDQQWLDTNFLPRAIQFGFKAIAIIPPDAYFNKVSVESISSKAAKNSLSVRFFDNIQDAEAWISLQQ